jgi:hypothetical protein
MEIWQELRSLTIDEVVANDKMVCLFINDGQAVSMAVSLFPLLSQASHECLHNFTLVDDGSAVHWPECGQTINLSDVLGD